MPFPTTWLDPGTVWSQREKQTYHLPPWEAPWGHPHKSREPRVSCLNPGKTSRDLLQHVSRPDSPIEQSHVSCSLSPQVAFKNSSLKSIREFKSLECKPPFLPTWSCNKPVCVLNSNISDCFASLWILHTNLGLTTISLEIYSFSLSLSHSVGYFQLWGHLIVQSWYKNLNFNIYCVG